MKSPTTLIASLACCLVVFGVGLAFYSNKTGSETKIPVVPMDTAIETPDPTPPAITPEPTPKVTSSVTVSAPLPNTQIKSPLMVSGLAPGTWFFEGSFPVTLRDRSGNTIATGIATSTENWMTEQTIPFAATLVWTNATGTEGVLVLKKDNPSGDPAHDENLEIPVSL